MSKTKPSTEAVRAQHSHRMSDKNFHAMLLTICAGCDVESSELEKGGTVTKIFRDADGIPTSVRVVAGEEDEYSFTIPLDMVDLFEPTSECDYYEIVDEWRWC